MKIQDALTYMRDQFDLEDRPDVAEVCAEAAATIARLTSERDAAVRDLGAYQVAAAIVKDKCEQYWNVSGIADAEVHAMLAFIHRSLQNAARPSSEEGGG